MRAIVGGRHTDYQPTAWVPGNNVPVVTFTRSIRLNWAAISGATGYQIWRENTNGSWSGQLAPASFNSTVFTDTTAPVGVQVRYGVRAIVGGRHTDYQPTGWVTPSPADSIPKVNVWGVAGGIRLEWARVPNATGYAIWREHTNGTWSGQLVPASFNNTTFIDAAAPVGVQVRYGVRAIVDGRHTAYMPTAWVSH